MQMHRNLQQLRIVGKYFAKICKDFCVVYHTHNNAYITTTGALSVTDSDDDYCVSYTVIMVDVRSCTGPPRSHDQQYITHKSTPPRSRDQTYISECTQPKSHYSYSSTSVGEIYHHYVSCIYIYIVYIGT